MGSPSPRAIRSPVSRYCETSARFITSSSSVSSAPICFAVRSSPRASVGWRFGRGGGGARENPVRMAAMGFDVYRFQLATYVTAGALAGLSGFLLANATEFVSPAYMSWQRSGELIVMVLLGGLGSLD